MFISFNSILPKKNRYSKTKCACKSLSGNGELYAHTVNLGAISHQITLEKYKMNTQVKNLNQFTANTTVFLINVHPQLFFCSVPAEKLQSPYLKLEEIL